ncbi:MAG: diguanylate cyclase [Planctomycetota bacterium]
MPETHNIAAPVAENVKVAMIKRAERLRYLENILNFSPDVIVCGDSRGKIVEYNRGAEKLLGYARNEVLGKPVADLYYNPRDRYKLIDLLQRKGQVVDYETRLKNKAGKIIYISTSVAYIYDERGRVVGTIGIAKDIRRRKEMEKKLERLAITDGLTNLYDRGCFNTSLPKMLEKAQRSNELLGCIMMDLDGFKEYNDKEGHLGGDYVLRKVGEIILAALPNKTSTAYRYGGDEFIVLLFAKKQSHMTAIGEKIRKEIEQEFKREITASIGVTCFRRFQTATNLVKMADNAMYRAKSYGGNRVCVA